MSASGSLRLAAKLRGASAALLKEDSRAYATSSAAVSSKDVNKPELIKSLRGKTGMTSAACKRVLDAMVETVIEAVSQGQKVNISGFGAFSRVSRAPRKVRDINSGAEIDVAGHFSPVFRSGKTFGEAVKTVKWTP